MIQQINLYREELRGQRVALPATQLLMAVGAVLLIMLAWYGIVAWQLHQARAEHLVLDPQRQGLTAELQSLAKQIEARRTDVRLERLLAQAKLEQQQKLELLDALEGSEVGNRVGFSPYLSGLGRQRIDDLWLTEILVMDGGRELALTGRTLKADLVPGYLRALSAETPFQGRQFTSFWLDGESSDEPALAFALATRCELRDGSRVEADGCRVAQEVRR